MYSVLKRKWLIFAVIAVILTATVVAGAVDNDGAKQADLSLEECFRLAEENNNNIKIAYMGIDKAKISKKKFDKQYDQYDDALKAPRRGNGSPDPFDDPLAPIKEMLTGMFTPSLTTYDTLSSMEVGKVMSELGVDLAEAGYEYVVRQIKFAVEAAYYAALQARDNVEIHSASLERTEEQLKLSELEFKVGRVAKRDVLDSEVQAARARAEYNQALRERDIAYMKLKEIIGLDLDAPINLTSDFTFKLGDEEINLEESIKKALKDRIEVIQAEYALKAAEKGFEVAKASYAPNVNIYKEAEYDYQEALLKLEDAKTAVETDVREAYLKMKGAEESISVLEKSVEFARESARLAKLQYQAGFIRSIDVLTVENALKQVEVQKAAVIYGYNLAKAQCYNAIGGRN